MKATTKFFLSGTGLMVLNVLGKLLFDIEPLSIEAVITLALAVTYCINEDDKK